MVEKGVSLLQGRACGVYLNGENTNLQKLHGG